jgi:hypothetical protein
MNSDNGRLQVTVWRTFSETVSKPIQPKTGSKIFVSNFSAVSELEMWLFEIIVKVK